MEREPESLDEQALMEDDGLEWDTINHRYVYTERDTGFGGQDITYDVDPPEYHSDAEDDYLLEIFADYEKTTDERLSDDS